MVYTAGESCNKDSLEPIDMELAPELDMMHLFPDVASDDHSSVLWGGSKAGLTRCASTRSSAGMSCSTVWLHCTKN